MALLLILFIVYYAYRKNKSKGDSFSSSIPLSTKADHGNFVMIIYKQFLSLLLAGSCLLCLYEICF